ELRVMHSAAGVTTPTAAGDIPVSMVVSGPAGGVLGALAVARLAGFPEIITFDMGGTSTDVALCDGEPAYRTATEIDGMALHTPVVDVVTVGAGGGSIARLDAGGALVVGPESAGADPGPACYGRGTLPTVSDANLALGRLRAGHFLGGEMVLDEARAIDALSRLGDPVDVAAAVVEVVNVSMARALRAVSLQRGFDPARFTLVAFGGAGPLHACDLAASLGMPRVLVPRYPGVLSALGMVTAPESVERSRSALLVVKEEATGELTATADSLRRELAVAASAAGIDAASIAWSADARYQGQAHELRVAFEVPTPSSIAAAFEAAHDRQYGYRVDGRSVELVNLRLRFSAPLPPSPLVAVAAGEPARAPVAEPITVAGEPASRIEREALLTAHTFEGPAIVTQLDATTVVPRGWRGRVDTYLNLILEPAP
ncbi:MAG: hydantoinase/oxoprolinase family protein, partial [Tepidiformaceae bacterium]